MDYATTTAIVIILALMALFDIMSTAYVLTHEPQRFHEGNPLIAALMHAIGILPALMVMRLPFVAWAVLYGLPQQVSPWVPTSLLVWVADTPDWAFITMLVFYAWVCWNNLQALLIALRSEGKL